MSAWPNPNNITANPVYWILVSIITMTDCIVWWDR